jgi:hypothetical protein
MASTPAQLLPKVSSSPDASTQPRRSDLVDVVGLPSTREMSLSHRLGVTCLSVVSADPTRLVAVVIHHNSYISPDR